MGINAEQSRVRNWKLTLAYDGTDYHGWQVQPDRLTIQGELVNAIERVTGERVLAQGSGRTDAGVHAEGQVASVFLDAPIPPENLQRALNRTLPEAIRVLQAELAAPEFHARHSVVAKTYEYRIARGEICPPFLSRFAWALNWPLDVARMQAAARVVIGTHDFTSFAATDPDLATRRNVDDGPEEGGEDNDGPGGALERDGERAAERDGNVRTVFESAWSSDDDLLRYRVRGNGFLHHMVRNLVGTFIDVGRGHVGSEDVAEILAARSRSAAGATAPARGLFLIGVEYPD
ncbi:MAG: tRNA pseudouridine synthase A [Acidobacteriaceae bacterium]